MRCACPPHFTAQGSGNAARCVRTSCPAGYDLINRQCYTKCDQYHTRQGTACVRTSCPAGQDLVGTTCYPGCGQYFTRQGIACLRSSCPPGERLVGGIGGTCEAICEEHFTWQDGSCVRTSCPAGENLVEGACYSHCESTDLTIGTRRRTFARAQHGTTERGTTTYHVTVGHGDRATQELRTRTWTATCDAPRWSLTSSLVEQEEQDGGDEDAGWGGGDGPGSE